MSPFECRIVPTIQYAENQERRQAMDLYLPDDTDEDKIPLIINIHGGGWTAGDRGPLDSEVFFVKNGFAYVRTNYRFATQAPHPAQIEDLHMALHWIVAHAAQYSIDLNRVYTIGHSAGGHLASLLALFPWHHSECAIRAVVNQAGPTDLAWAAQRKESAKHFAPEKPSPIDVLLGCPALENLKFAYQASPIHYVDRTTPPHLLLYGDSDEIVPAEHGQRFHNKMQKSEAESELVIMPGADHVHPAYWETENFQRILDFFNKHA